MVDKKRFIRTTSQSGVRFIKDAQSGEVVCIMNKGKRPPEHTEAMIKVMLDALNGAVEKKITGSCKRNGTSSALLSHDKEETA
ncbi:hypothetical protein [uncultured Desulfovibrio sp.]|uniref:hypothetical protein n=1 Tax=uncultured Desulfovibrio sp. TaxID=167968 RepID=UPI0025DAF7E3|nr:hypothetical protein [uncultured Desulfovibrio sp.]